MEAPTATAAGDSSPLLSAAASLATLAMLLRDRGTPGPRPGDVAVDAPPGGRGGVERRDRVRLAGDTERLTGEVPRGRLATPSGPVKPAMLPPPSMLVSGTSSWKDTRRPAKRLDMACGTAAGDVSAWAAGDDNADEAAGKGTRPMSCKRVRAEGSTRRQSERLWQKAARCKEIQRHAQARTTMSLRASMAAPSRCRMRCSATSFASRYCAIASSEIDPRRPRPVAAGARVGETPSASAAASPSADDSVARFSMPSRILAFASTSCACCCTKSMMCLLQTSEMRHGIGAR